jgi:hypothetical protein
MRRGFALALLLGLPLAADAVDGGAWRFTHALPAPWGEALPGAANLAGQRLAFGAAALEGPDPIACAPATIEQLTVPAEGLFEGGLGEQAEGRARLLGISTFPVPLIRVSCPNAAFDFARVDADTLLFALDNQVWSLSQAPGALAAADTPEAAVQALLETHYAGELGFTPESVAAKAGQLSTALRQAIADHFAQPWPKDEVPPINGDPFTDSQEYPTRFAVGAASVEGDAAEVVVRFADAFVAYELGYRLRREDGAWRIDDVIGRDRSGLRELLTSRP